MKFKPNYENIAQVGGCHFSTLLWSLRVLRCDRGWRLTHLGWSAAMSPMIVSEAVGGLYVSLFRFSSLVYYGFNVILL